jgi:hypothetical protein
MKGLISLLWCPRCMSLGLVDVVSFHVFIFPTNFDTVTSSETASSGLECLKPDYATRDVGTLCKVVLTLQDHAGCYRRHHPIITEIYFKATPTMVCIIGHCRDHLPGSRGAGQLSYYMLTRKTEEKPMG